MHFLINQGSIAEFNINPAVVNKIYVLDNLVNQYKETYTSHANKFYPLSNIES